MIVLIGVGMLLGADEVGKLATLRSFYKFLVKRNRVSSNPVVGIRTPKEKSPSAFPRI